MGDDDLRRLHREAKAALAKYSGVIGVGYGYKERGGRVTDELAFRVYVDAKKPPAELRPEDLVPGEFGGIPTDVVEAPEPVPIGACEDETGHAPLISGITITNGKSDAGGLGVGTLGFFATVDGGSTDPHNVVLVSNNHVLCNLGAGAGDSIYQPRWKPPPPGQPMIASIDNVGMDGAFPYDYPEDPVTFPTDTYKVDAATAKLDICISTICHWNCGVSFDNKFRDAPPGPTQAPIAGVARVQPTDVTPAGYQVIKVGRRTGRTVGKVVDAHGHTKTDNSYVITIDATQNSCDGILQFVDEGDSGSALVNAKGELIGIIFAKDAQKVERAYACHIGPVLKRLGVTPITTQNPPANNPAFDGSAAPAPAAPGTPAPTPAPAPAAKSVMSPERVTNPARVIQERLLESEIGRGITEAVELHRGEVIHLVNRCRPVTVAWHRSKGPAFVAEAVANAYDPAHAIPREVEGVAREMLVKRMANVLMEHGSAGLRAIVERFHEEILAYVVATDSVHELLDRFAAEPVT